MFLYTAKSRFETLIKLLEKSSQKENHEIYSGSFKKEATDKISEAKKENKVLRHALIEVFSELKKVQNTRDLEEVLKIPSVYKFSKILEKRYETDVEDHLFIENKRIKLALTEIYKKLKKSETMPTLEETLQLPEVFRFVRAVEERTEIDSPNSDIEDAFLVA